MRFLLVSNPLCSSINDLPPTGPSPFTSLGTIDLMSCHVACIALTFSRLEHRTAPAQLYGLRSDRATGAALTPIAAARGSRRTACAVRGSVWYHWRQAGMTRRSKNRRVMFTKL